MFDSISFILEIHALIKSDRAKEAEERLLRAYAELKAVNDIAELEHVASELAHLYCMPETEDLNKAEAYFLERETLSPGAYTKLQTSLFYFYIASNFPKTISKVNEITSLREHGNNTSYYSALALKGHAFINLDRLDDAREVLKELFSMIKANPPKFPFGDEMNFLEAAMSHKALVPTSRQILELIIPNIRSTEYVKRAESLLKSA